MLRIGERDWTGATYDTAWNQVWNYKVEIWHCKSNRYGYRVI